MERLELSKENLGEEILAEIINKTARRELVKNGIHDRITAELSDSTGFLGKISKFFNLMPWLPCTLYLIPCT